MAKRRSSKKDRQPHDAFENAVPADEMLLDYTDEQLDVEAELAVEASARRKVIEVMRPSDMLPDRLQPRPSLLPPDIAERFYSGEIDCYEAAREWRKRARGDKGMTHRIEGLLAMGDGIEEHGQIKPITGSYVDFPGSDMPVFVIETGERRFWSVVLRAVKRRVAKETELEVEIVDKPSAARQVIENIQMEEPSAVGKAREIAALILQSLGVERDWSIQDPYEFYRQALSRPGRARLPKGTWKEIGKIMQLSERRLQQILSVLRLHSHLLDKADLYRLPDRVLRAILAEDGEKWEALMEGAIQHQLSSEAIEAAAAGEDIEEIKELAEKVSKRRDDTRRKPERIAFGGIRRFARAAINVSDDKSRRRMLDDVADEVVVQGLADKLIPLLKELTRLIEARQSRL